MGNTTLEFDDDVAWITMDDGKVNVMSTALLGELAGRLDEARKARVTVLIGRPGIFSAGFDLGTLRRGSDATRDMMGAGIGLIMTMLAHPNPIITGCTGHAYPMGAFLMMSADIRYGVAAPAGRSLHRDNAGWTGPVPGPSKTACRPGCFWFRE